MRQQSEARRAGDYFRLERLFCQPLLEEPYAEARLALELLGILVAVREDDRRFDADQRKAQRADAAQERGVARHDPLEGAEESFDVQGLAVLEIRQNVRFEAERSEQRARGFEHAWFVERGEGVLQHHDDPGVFRKALE